MSRLHKALRHSPSRPPINSQVLLGTHRLSRSDFYSRARIKRLPVGDRLIDPGSGGSGETALLLLHADLLRDPGRIFGIGLSHRAAMNRLVAERADAFANVKT